MSESNLPSASVSASVSDSGSESAISMTLGLDAALEFLGARLAFRAPAKISG